MWHFNGNPISYLENLPNHESAAGFVYMITNKVTGKIYIGKKSLFSVRKKRIGKREKAETKTRKTFKQEIKESDWKTYYGSSEELLKDIETHGQENFHREILEVCYSKKYLGYCELAHQIKYDVLRKDSYNGNILGRFWRKDMQ
jgi:hypothetical protein